LPKIGPVNLKSPFCQAGLAGYSDRAMRLVARRRGCAYAVTEALLDVILLSGGQGLKKSIDINEEDHPIAGQIIGSEPETMARAAIILADRDYDCVDLNFACPVKKIKNKSRGGHMLADVPRAKGILNAVMNAVGSRKPITVSLRRGFDDSEESADRFYEIFEFAFSIGITAVRVHARSVEQKYLGQARWPFLADLKRKHPDKTIFGSGDVFTPHEAVRMIRETGVDVVWIARGAIGNPWIFSQAEKLLADPNYAVIAPTIFQQRDALLEHFQIAMQIHGEQLAGRRMRKMGIKYSRFHPAHLEVKENFIRVHSLRDWQEVLDRWYLQDGPGVMPPANLSDEVNSATDCATETALETV
jgi:nifR3 family TIM-barrel protein